MLFKSIVLSLAITTISCGRKEDITRALDWDSFERKLETNRTSSFFCPEGYADKIKVAFAEAKKCVEDTYDENLLVCDLVQNYMQNCTQPILDVADPCLKENNKDFAVFVRNVLLSIVNYGCEADGAHLLELGNMCILKRTSGFHECMKKVTDKLETTLEKRAFPTAKEVCLFTDMIKPCLKHHVEEACPDTVTQDFYKNLYEAAFHKPCAKFKNTV